jgi:hypothetical protein
MVGEALRLPVPVGDRNMTVISSDGSPTTVRLIPTDEEIPLARKRPPQTMASMRWKARVHLGESKGLTGKKTPL